MSSAKTVFHTQVLPQESPLSRLLSRHHDGRHAGFVVYLNRASPRSMRRFVLKGLLVNIALTLVMAWLAAGTIFHDLVSPPQDCMDIIVSCIRDALIIFAILTMAVTTVVPFLCQSLLLVRFRSQPYRIVFRALNRPDDPAKDDSSLGADPLVDYYDIWDTLTKDVKHHFYLASVQTHALLAEGKVSEANLDGVIYQYADGVWHRWTTNDTTHQDYAEVGETVDLYCQPT
ncbi:hypothetical protein AX16_010414 [Volvariella volvacea WC 439]|nr:hypothetical protein AX16_010414 [Volvariella volvacea WC 439]